MPNRIIKESICTSDTIDQLSSDEERLFYRLIINCEDYGRMQARPEIIRAKCFPLKIDQIPIKDIENWLSKLIAVGLIVIYKNNEKKYLQYLTWENHQQIRAGKPKFPGPDDEGSILISSDIHCNQEKSDVPVSIRISNTNNERTKERKPSASDNKKKYADFVTLTEEEYQKLIEKFGMEDATNRIENLNLWKGSKGKKTASDYMTILNWARRESADKNKPTLNQPLPSNHSAIEKLEFELKQEYGNINFANFPSGPGCKCGGRHGWMVDAKGNINPNDPWISEGEYKIWHICPCEKIQKLKKLKGG